MQKKIILFIFLLSLSWISGIAQVDHEKQKHDIAIIKAFLLDVADESIRPDLILSKHVRIEEMSSNEEYDYLEASINEIRLNLQTKNIAEIAYIPFRSLPKQDIRDIDPEGKPTENMYFLRYKNRQMLALYLEDNKIASFTLVSKGNKTAHFVTY
ncbi:hypothetical protein [Sphingobacterium griseoflavum]|uniref:DUF4252 domain-containing protein n=1 Tax=Sphingobacterium griseoflavum TaxID=1474952 RepID=A0ABQ3HQY4_9SPHI|nr:hypothetical protein [Sphingobacterium griseoflavum]GHE23681.1 hypothetical protein GCM10017764_06490 [Sphingobacterium griseoflavum]